MGYDYYFTFIFNSCEFSTNIYDTTNIYNTTKKMPRPKFSIDERRQVYNKANNPYGVGKCWHCGVAISSDHFHIDHYPVCARDIEGQIILGVTDMKDINNLVPSCVSCNTSHRHERDVCCGKSQCRCTLLIVFQLTTFVCTLLAIFFATIYGYSILQCT